jgi:hypothetical protein
MYSHEHRVNEPNLAVVREAFATAEAKEFAIKVGPCISTLPFNSTPLITFLLLMLLDQLARHLH